eukprot:gene1784-1306_t
MSLYCARERCGSERCACELCCSARVLSWDAQLWCSASIHRATSDHGCSAMVLSYGAVVLNY